jgi:hypothetical protein
MGAPFFSRSERVGLLNSRLLARVETACHASNPVLGLIVRNLVRFAPTG